MMSAFRKNASLVMIALLVILSGTALLHVSQNVYSQKQQVKKIMTDISKTEKEIRSLNAEIAFLSTPERLDQISSAITVSVAPTQPSPMVIKASDLSDQTSLFQTVKPIAKPIKLAPTPQREQTINFSNLISEIGG
jgi:cell division protein FtsL